MPHRRTLLYPRLRAILAGPALAAVAACASPPANAPLAVRLAADARESLGIDPPSPEFYRAYARLEQAGPLLDPILVLIADDASANAALRANALMLLAERRPTAAIFVLRRALLTSRDPRVRSGAIFGLKRLLPDNAEAANAIRMALGDPDRRVRTSALQALDFRDAADIRLLLRRERDSEVRTVAEQLLALAEARGAPLLPDSAGGYRTVGLANEPRLVFRAASRDTVSALATGEIRLDGPFRQSRPLADGVEVVAGVVPAFFSPDRSAVVFEANREIRVRNVSGGEARVVGRGIAPRPLPLTDEFVFVRPLRSAPRADGTGTELLYEVFSAGFGGAEPRLLGQLRAVAKPNVHAHASPVRWMVVADAPNGFVLRGENLEEFLLPHPAVQPVSGSGDGSGAAAQPLPF